MQKHAAVQAASARLPTVTVPDEVPEHLRDLYLSLPPVFGSEVLRPLLGDSERTFRARIARGEFPCAKVGERGSAKLRFTRMGVIRWFAERSR